MLSDILWSTIILIFVIFGLKRPYLALCGVIFVDILRPQTLSFSFLAHKPISLIMVLILILSILINLKQTSMPKKKSPLVFIIFFMFWITLSTYFAEFQVHAWFKYDFVIKTILFALFIPFIINSRVKFDTFIAILVVSTSFFTIALGMTTLIGGGGYGHNLFHSNSAGSTAMTESSTMAMAAIINIPLIIYISKYSVFKEQIKFLNLTSKLLIFASLLSIIGTFARTGLVGLAAWVGLNFLNIKHRIRYLLLLIITIAIATPFLPGEWLDRMGTISSGNKESSAYGRIVVWKWTLDYVSERPILGGGFQSFIANAGELHKYVEEGKSIQLKSKGKAYHNIFFEVLGEQGYVGLMIYLTMIWQVLSINRKLIKQDRNESWITGAATALRHSLIIYCVCGMFIGVAYYPWLFYFITLTMSLYHVHSIISSQTEAPLSYKKKDIVHGSKQIDLT